MSAGDDAGGPDTPPREGEVWPGRDDILLLARLAGLALPEAYEGELVSAYGHVRRLVALLPELHGHSDEPAHVFVPLAFQPDRQ